METTTIHIKNFAKIDSVSLNLSGLTVIVGKNNSGKSTVGKALYALCRVFHNLDERVKQSMDHSIHQEAEKLIGFLPESILHKTIDVISRKNGTFQDVISSLHGRERNLMDSVFLENKSFSNEIQRRIDTLKSKISEIHAILPQRYKEAIVWDYFNAVFHSQVLPLFRNSGETRIVFEGDERIDVILHSTTADLREIGRPKNNVWYVNGPRVLNFVNSTSNLDALDVYDRELLDALKNFQGQTSPSGIVDASKVVNRKKLEELETCFAKVVKNSSTVQNTHEYGVPQDGCQGPVLYENLSSGLKSFVLLRHMLSEGILTVGDILILDEPEVNLHPEWQIIYAELVVLLCKTFDIKILLTSHSVDFIHALRLYAKLHGMENRLSLYKSIPHLNGPIKIRPVSSDNWKKLFEEFVKAIDILEKLRAKTEEAK